MKLADYLKEKGLRPSPWAIKHGMSPSIISRYLRGLTKPDTNTVLKIIEATNGSVSLTDICMEANQKTIQI